MSVAGKQRLSEMDTSRELLHVQVHLDLVLIIPFLALETAAQTLIRRLR